MNKTIVVIVFALLFQISGSAVLAASATPTPTTAPTTVNDKTQAIDNKINELKNKITNKVAQLKLVEKRGFLGTVTESSNTQITLTDMKGKTRYIDVDELTKFSSSQIKGTFGISDIKKGMMLEILGLYNKDSQRTLAREISYEEEATYVHGTVVNIDTANKNIGIKSDAGKDITLSIGNSAKIEMYTKADGLTRASFSKVAVGQHVIASGFNDTTTSNTIDVGHLIIFSEIPSDPKINAGAIPSDTAAPTGKSTK